MEHRLEANLPLVHLTLDANYRAPPLERPASAANGTSVWLAGWLGLAHSSQS